MATMRISSIALAACVASSALAWAQQPPADRPAQAQPAVKSEVQSQAPVQAELHRAMADLIEARSGSPADPAKIQALTEKVQRLRGQLAPAQPGLGCAWGGPGRGFGPGYGRGPGWGGRGAGWGGGYGWGGGRGYGWGFVDADHNGVCDRFEQATGQHQ